MRVTVIATGFEQRREAPAAAAETVVNTGIKNDNIDEIEEIFSVFKR